MIERKINLRWIRSVFICAREAQSHCAMEAGLSLALVGCLFAADGVQGTSGEPSGKTRRDCSTLLLGTIVIAPVKAKGSSEIDVKF